MVNECNKLLNEDNSNKSITNLLSNRTQYLIKSTLKHPIGNEGYKDTFNQPPASVPARRQTNTSASAGTALICPLASYNSVILFAYASALVDLAGLVTSSDMHLLLEG